MQENIYKHIYLEGEYIIFLFFSFADKEWRQPGVLPHLGVDIGKIYSLITRSNCWELEKLLLIALYNIS